MGEQAYITGTADSVKIGTCENMYYLRFDQLDQISRRDENSLDPRDPAVWASIRFRFPFPDEDDIPAGEFRDYGRGVNIEDSEIAANAISDHHGVQFISNKPLSDRGGWNVVLPCPVSADARELADDDGPRIMRNGGQVGLTIVQQRVWGTGPDAVLALVVRCAGCDALVSLTTADAAIPVIQACLARAEQSDGDESIEWTTIGRRILDGYMNPPARIRSE